MGIKVVKESEAPPRLKKRGVLSGTPEWAEALTQFRNCKAGEAVVVTLESPAFKEVKKAEVTFAYNLRRFFSANNIPATAYQSGVNEVTLRRQAAPPVAKKRGPRK